MKKILVYITISIVIMACARHPRNFTYKYEGTDTGLSERIDIGRYYISQHGCDPTFFSVYRFYPDGLFKIATTSNVNIFTTAHRMDSARIEAYYLWGTYRLEGNLIRTQTIRPEGSGCVIFRDYEILPDGGIMNVSDYVEPRFTNLGYMQNYPSFRVNPCPRRAILAHSVDTIVRHD